MTVFASFSELAGSYRALSSVLSQQATTVREAASIVEDSVAAASGKYRGHKIVATRAVVSGDTALVRMTSRKAHLLDHDTKAHSEAPKVASAMGGPRLAHPLTGIVFHPGTRGKDMWETGVTIALPAIGDMRLEQISSYELSTTQAAFKRVFG